MRLLQLFLILSLAIAIVTLPFPFTSAAAPTWYCQRTDPTCWPTSTDVEQLRIALNPAINRTIYWEGGDAPRVMAIPTGSPGDQPFYGQGVNLQPLYVQSNEDKTGTTCFAPNITSYCIQSMRNSPAEGWTPAFVVWPTTTAHVQTIVKFAIKHNLCMAVAGTGHDYKNRHSCPDGLLIRMSLFKSKSFDAKPNLFSPHGRFTFGAGLVFSEAHEFAAKYNRYVASGWMSTVGVVGWSTGGGHGPHAPIAGLGVDNIQSVQLVTAEGKLITASWTQNQDLFWALRGGSGSTWGIITSITLRAHLIPTGGFTVATVAWLGVMCGPSLDQLNYLNGAYLNWSQALDHRWSGLAFWFHQPGASACERSWIFTVQYVYHGAQTDTAFTNTWTPFSSQFPFPAPLLPPIPQLRIFGSCLPQGCAQVSVENYSNWYKASQSQGIFWDWIKPEPAAPTAPVNEFVGGIPSVLISREKTLDGSVLANLNARFAECAATGRCPILNIVHAITGNTGSQAATLRDSFDSRFVSISPGFRNSLYHLLQLGDETKTQVKTDLYSLGPYSYPAESAYAYEGKEWQKRFWGDLNYLVLLIIKARYDPNHRFWCVTCVGSDATRASGYGCNPATVTNVDTLSSEIDTSAIDAPELSSSSSSSSSMSTGIMIAIIVPSAIAFVAILAGLVMWRRRKTHGSTTVAKTAEAIQL